MKKGGGKRKGAAFEREVCSLLSRWVSGTADDIFWRSSLSGGRATVRSRKGKTVSTQFGDISAVDPRGTPFLEVFYVELKHYRNLDFMSFVLKGRGTLSKFWDVCVREASRYNRIPMLIGKQNLYPAFCLLPPSLSCVFPDPVLIRGCAVLFLFDGMLRESAQRLIEAGRSILDGG